MKLPKTFFAVTVAATLFAGAASALSVDQCNQLGGQVNLASAECLLTAAQQEEARANRSRYLRMTPAGRFLTRIKANFGLVNRVFLPQPIG